MKFCREERLYYRTADGFFHTKTFYWWIGKSYIRVTYTNTRDREVSEYTMDIPSNEGEGVLESLFDQHITFGWDTDIDVLAQNEPVMNFEDWPEDFQFAKFGENPDPERMMPGTYTMWAPVRGQSIFVFISERYVRAFSRTGERINLDQRVLLEAARAYPPNTILRGVYDGLIFHVWDVPFKGGIDLISFDGFRTRLPKYSGRFVQKHEPLTERSDTFILVDEDVAAGGTAYGNPAWSKGVSLRGVWLCHPTLERPRLRIALPQRAQALEVVERVLS